MAGKVGSQPHREVARCRVSHRAVHQADQVFGCFPVAVERQFEIGEVEPEQDFLQVRGARARIFATHGIELECLVRRINPRQQLCHVKQQCRRGHLENMQIVAQNGPIRRIPRGTTRTHRDPQGTDQSLRLTRQHRFDGGHLHEVLDESADADHQQRLIGGFDIVGLLAFSAGARDVHQQAARHHRIILHNRGYLAHAKFLEVAAHHG